MPGDVFSPDRALDTENRQERVLPTHNGSIENDSRRYSSSYSCSIKSVPEQ